MQVSGSSNSNSLYQYFLELAQLRKTETSQTSQNSQSSAAELFAQADSDGDGGVAASEFASFLAKAGGSASATEATTEASSTEAVMNRPPPPPAQSLSEEETNALFLEGDTDGDGVLSAQEFAALHEKTRPAEPPQNGGGRNDNDLLSQLGASSGYGFAADAAGQSSYGSMFSDALKDLTATSVSESSMSRFMQNMVREAYGA